MQLVEFSERHSFGLRERHLVNPEFVTSLSGVDYDQETIIHMKDGRSIQVEGCLDKVRGKLTGRD